MAIVVIIGIVAAMAAPRFSRTISRLKFRTSARDIVSKMRLARSNAITHKQPFGVNLDNSDMTMTMFVDTYNPGSFTFESADSVISVDTLPDGFVYLGTDFGQTAVVYRPNGSASQTGHVYCVTNNGTDGVNIGIFHVLASTGRTKIESLNYY
jgi:Tfp pilus assembly protein FimT